MEERNMNEEAGEKKEEEVQKIRGYTDGGGRRGVQGAGMKDMSAEDEGSRGGE